MSDILLGAAGAAHAAFGIGLIKVPEATLNLMQPALALLEDKFGLPSITPKAGDVTVNALLAVVGVLQIFLGYIFIWAVYTKDEKCKRNSVPGRFALGMAALYVCKNTPHGSSLVAFVAFTAVIPAFVLGLDVGFGDGNAVDLEIEEAKRIADAKLEVKAAENPKTK